MDDKKWVIYGKPAEEGKGREVYFTTCSSVYAETAVNSSAYQTSQTIDPSFQYPDRGRPDEKFRDVFVLRDLGEEAKRVFEEFYKTFPQKTPSFEKLAMEFFDAANNDKSAHDKFFSNFTPLWKKLLHDHVFDTAEAIWKDVLETVFLWESSNQGKRIHKGTPYYFWGVTALIKGDIDRGFLLMHQALKEDIQTAGASAPDTPAYALVTLNFEKSDQFFKDWVLEMVAYLKTLLENYRQLMGKKFTVEDFRKKFLLQPPNIETVFLLSYSLARIYRLSKVPKHTLANSFAGQLQTNVLFDLTIVIDEAISVKNPKGGTFIHQLVFISQNSGLGTNQERLGEINERFKNDFQTMMADLLGGLFKFKNGSGLSRIESYLAVSYGIRNLGAHKAASYPIIWQNYKEIERILFNTLFFCVESLY